MVNVVAVAGSAPRPNLSVANPKSSDSSRIHSGNERLSNYRNLALSIRHAAGPPLMPRLACDAARDNAVASGTNEGSGERRPRPASVPAVARSQSSQVRRIGGGPNDASSVSRPARAERFPELAPSRNGEFAEIARRTGAQ